MEPGDLAQEGRRHRPGRLSGHGDTDARSSWDPSHHVVWSAFLPGRASGSSPGTRGLCRWEGTTTEGTALAPGSALGKRQAVTVVLFAPGRLGTQGAQLVPRGPGQPQGRPLCSGGLGQLSALSGRLRRARSTTWRGKARCFGTFTPVPPSSRAPSTRQQEKTPKAFMGTVDAFSLCSPAQCPSSLHTRLPPQRCVCVWREGPMLAHGSGLKGPRDPGWACCAVTGPGPAE